MSINEQLLQIITEIATALNQEPIPFKELSTQDLVNALKHQITTLLELVTQNRTYDYDQLEKAVQKAEAEIRSHVRLEQQMKLYADNLQEKVDQLELEKQQMMDDKKSQTLQLNFGTSKDQEKKSTNNISQQRDFSPNVIKKSYIMGNQIYHRQHQSNIITYQDHQFPKHSSQEPINRERRSANTQHVSYIPGKGLPIKNVTNASLNTNANNPPSNRREDKNKSQQSQERITDKSQSLLKSQHSYSYIKMYNIQKLIINKNQNDNKTLTQQTKSKTIHGACNNILDESHYRKK